jgi:hypothetical protein
VAPPCGLAAVGVDLRPPVEGNRRVLVGKRATRAEVVEELTTEHHQLLVAVQ